MKVTKEERLKIIYYLESYKDLIEEGNYEDDSPEEEEIKDINNLIKLLK